MTVKAIAIKRPPEEIREVEVQRPERVKLSAEKAFTAKRKEIIVAIVRKAFR